ncbi:NAD(P)H-dependent oxidoreductase [Chlorobium ferrooxidans]|uniref:NAD(P)H dehydrogenase (Quinone) n=1 Tax=Chlorobium ferrooxidans DSM 13031 TaxID=377431 RepID=Q0YUM9_9CHLB|nr:NAD(P)H-dependent oxidoreductase [Chlorobium ferrooxidans]EAT60003.1 NAD(P)H dehydrogenase (quinone) [Chlorobium ferrooxidans DSM 13031]
MKTLILDGSPAGDRVGMLSVADLQAHLAERGSTSEVVALRDKKIGNCMGDFYCWFKSPGKCHVADDNQEISGKYLESDLVIFLSPITFGGYSPTLKRMVDHMIQNTLPFFATHSGEIHHMQRYERYPDVLTIGWQREPDKEAASVFRHLAWRNSINFYAKVHACGILSGNQADRVMEAELHRVLDQIDRHESDAVPALPEIRCSSATPVSPRRALLLVGSPRLEKSTSSSLGSYLFEQLQQQGLETETIYLYKVINSAERMEALREAIAMADLAVLAFPLYVDTLPAPVISVLEDVVAHCKGKTKPTRFSAIVNCGFPEASQNESAVALCAGFARDAGFEWMGGLSLGAGEGMVQARPLGEMGGQGASLRRALEIAAGELGEGKAISESAQELLAKPVMPQWLYKLGGTISWKMRARKFGTQKLLKARPYEKAV